MQKKERHKTRNDARWKAMQGKEQVATTQGEEQAISTQGEEQA
jgi:hypothetical protein